MFQTIEKLRSKPESAKKRIAFLIAFLISGLIFVVWLTIIFPDFKKTQDKESSIAKSGVSPISAFSDAISSSYGAVSSQISKIKEAVGALNSPEVFRNSTSATEATTSSNYIVYPSATTTN